MSKKLVEQAADVFVRATVDTVERAATEIEDLADQARAAGQERDAERIEYYLEGLYHLAQSDKPRE